MFDVTTLGAAATLDQPVLHKACAMRADRASPPDHR
jgi:hypothetical protein